MKIQICGCGNNHDVVSIATQMAKQVKFDHTSPTGDCAIWHAAVAEAFALIIGRMFEESMLATWVRLHGADMPDLESRATESLNKCMDETRQRVLYAFVNDEEQNQKLMDLMTEHFKIPVHKPEGFLKGPSFVKESGSGLGDLLKAIGLVPDTKSKPN